METKGKPVMGSDRQLKAQVFSKYKNNPDFRGWDRKKLWEAVKRGGLK